MGSFASSAELLPVPNFHVVFTVPTRDRAPATPRVADFNLESVAGFRRNQQIAQARQPCWSE
jgi:hypothetical protein